MKNIDDHITAMFIKGNLVPQFYPENMDYYVAKKLQSLKSVAFNNDIFNTKRIMSTDVKRIIKENGK
jgi:hypothetical protein